MLVAAGRFRCWLGARLHCWSSLHDQPSIEQWWLRCFLGRGFAVVACRLGSWFSTGFFRRHWQNMSLRDVEQPVDQSRITDQFPRRWGLRLEWRRWFLFDRRSGWEVVQSGVCGWLCTWLFCRGCLPLQTVCLAEQRVEQSQVYHQLRWLVFWRLWRLLGRRWRFWMLVLPRCVRGRFRSGLLRRRCFALRQAIHQVGQQDVGGKLAWWRLGVHLFLGGKGGRLGGRLFCRAWRSKVRHDSGDCRGWRWCTEERVLGWASRQWLVSSVH